MEFRIADTFTASLDRLNVEEQKSVKITAFDLQRDPINSSMSFHKLDRARDKNFWSVRVTRDIRLIVHKTSGSLLLCYVAHHDQAYTWAERRRLETHPTTGAAQLVEIRQTVEETHGPVIPGSRSARSGKALFAQRPDNELLGYGVPAEWLDDVRQATEDTLLTLADHLPAEAAEALLEIATGGKPRQPIATATNPFDHPDALRRFRVMPNIEELQRALEAPWEKWTVFLHPDQRQIVEHNYNGPARVSGSAGTGKTIVALHRAVFLARANPEARILLTTLTPTLAKALRAKLRFLVSEEREPRLAERIEVHAIDTIGKQIYKVRIAKPQFASRQQIDILLQGTATHVNNHSFSQRFLYTEWEHIVDAWNLASWEAYRDVPRLGRRIRLTEQQRAQLWQIMSHVRMQLTASNQITQAGLFSQLATTLAANPNPPFDFVVVDEAQDVSIAQLRFLAALGSQRPDALFFAGDGGQRIFQQPFSWKSLGVDVRGRSRTLRVNYRTSHQIRTQADRLLAAHVSDLDGNTDQRNDTVSVFNGPAPSIREFASQQDEQNAVGLWLVERIQAGVAAHECGVFVRSEAELPRAHAAIAAAGQHFKQLDNHVETADSFIAVGTMHLAKGLEFRAVAVMACDDEIVPSQERINAIGDETDLKEVYDTERHLLYVACTRARDHLLVTSVKPSSEFLADLQTA